MLTYSQDFNDAIRSTDREMVGYVRFPHGSQWASVDKIIDGSKGLVSFTVKQIAMDNERFCIGSTVSSYCEIAINTASQTVDYSFNKNPFELYAGVKCGSVANVFSSTFGFQNGSAPLSSVRNELNALADGTVVTLTIGNGTPLKGTWIAGVGVSPSGGYYIAKDENDSWKVYALPEQDGWYRVTLATVGEEVKCLGQFYASKVVRKGNAVSATGYDIVNKMSIKYVPTVTSGANGYLVMDILNDIIDQTGVNNGNHFTNVGNAIYVPEIQKDTTCKEQWNWLMTLCDNYGSVYTGSRTNFGYIESKSYNGGSGYYDTYSTIDSTVIYMDGYTGAEDSPTFTISSLTTGTDENPISLGSGVGVNYYNPYITIAHATDIFNNLDGITYYPMNIDFRGDPCIEVMDSLKVIQNNTDCRCIAMGITTTFNGGFKQEIECWGDTEEYYDMSSGQLSPTVDKVNSIVDFIVDRGVASGWVYRKWNTGYVECWRRVTYTKASLTITQNGSVYEADVPAIAYPFTFSSAPREFMEITGNANANYDEPVFKMNYGGGNGNTTTQTGRYKACSFSAFSKGISIDYYVRGALPDHA